MKRILSLIKGGDIICELKGKDWIIIKDIGTLGGWKIGDIVKMRGQEGFWAEYIEPKENLFTKLYLTLKDENIY